MIDDWRRRDYSFDVQSNIALGEAAKIFAPETVLRGSASFTGKVEGEKDSYELNVTLTTDQLMASSTRLFNLKADGIKVESNGEQLSFAGKQIHAKESATSDARLSDLTISDIHGTLDNGQIKASIKQVAA